MQEPIAYYITITNWGEEQEIEEVYTLERLTEVRKGYGVIMMGKDIEIQHV